MRPPGNRPAVPGQRWRPGRAGAAAVAGSLLLGLVATGAVAQSARDGDTGAVHVPAPMTAPEVVATAEVEEATVTLVTGERVTVQTAPDGRPVVAELAGGAEPDATIVQFTWAGDLYAVPVLALPYLPNVLDPSLFNVSYLARAGLVDGVPVAVNGDLDSVPVSIGPDGAPVLEPDRAGELSALLAAHVTSGRLPGITRISLAAPDAMSPPPPPGQAPTDEITVVAPEGSADEPPAYHTLTVQLRDRHGGSGNGALFLQNVDDAGLALFWLNAQDEVAFSVPEGTYSLVAPVLSVDPATGEILTALTAVPEVRADSARTVVLDAREARPYDVSVEPSPGLAVRQDMLSFTRISRRGGGTTIAGTDYLNLGLLAVYPNPLPGTLPSGLLATPTAEVSTGTFGFNAHTMLRDGTPFGGIVSTPIYLLSFPQPNRIPDTLSYTVDEADLTTVRHQVHRSPSAWQCGQTPSLIANVYSPWGHALQLSQAVAYDVAPDAGRRVDYWYTSRPDLDVWQASMNLSDCTRRVGQRQLIEPGAVLEEVWNRSPLVPAANVVYLDSFTASLSGGGSMVEPLTAACQACRQGNVAQLMMAPFGDSQPGHYYYRPAYCVEACDLSFRRNGELVVTSEIAHGEYVLTPYAQQLPLLPEPTWYELEISTARPSDPTAVTRTVWTFHSSPDDQVADLPPQVHCAPDPDQPCAFLPLLFPRYDLELDLDSRAMANERFPVVFRVDSQHHAPPALVTATLAVSYDSGATWSDPIPAWSRADGSFIVSIPHPPLAETDGFVALWLQATDRAGNAVEQTIIRAYGLTE